MNEIELIRRQLAAERANAGAVAGACGTVAARFTHESDLHEDFAQASVDYLVRVLAWFEERDQRAADLAHAHGSRAREEATVRALEEALERPGRSRDALERLERAVAFGRGFGAGTQELWRDFVRYFQGVWSARRDAIDACLAATLRPAGWRVVAGIDADSILEERRRYERVRAVLPAGVPLGQSATMPAAH